jgi:hypothetical protein
MVAHPCTRRPVTIPSMNPRRLLLIPLLLLTLLAAAPRSARAINTIQWGGNLFATDITSTGANITSSFTFALGAFVNGFMPGTGNMDQWAGNFVVFDEALYNDDPLTFGTPFWASEASINLDRTSTSPEATPGATFAVGQKAYLWVYNLQVFDPTGANGAEWALVTADNWLFPAASPDCCDAEPPVIWDICDVDVPGLNEGPIYGSVGNLTGPGNYTLVPPPGECRIQTALVPEPSVAALVLFGLGVPLLRRRRG